MNDGEIVLVDAGTTGLTSPAGPRNPLMSVGQVWLKRLPDGFLAELSEDVAVAVSRVSNTRRIGARHVIHAEGRPADCVRVVRQGLVVLEQLTVDERTSTFELLGPGDMLGEEPLTVGRWRTSAISRSDTVIDEWPASGFDRLTREHPEVLRALVHHMADRLDDSRQLFTALRLIDAGERVAQLLVVLAYRFGHAAGNATIVEHGLTQQELARLAGTRRETVNKALKGFVRKGWIELNPRGVLIRDLDALQRAGLYEAKPGTEHRRSRHHLGRT